MIKGKIKAEEAASVCTHSSFCSSHSGAVTQLSINKSMFTLFGFSTFLLLF